MRGIDKVQTSGEKMSADDENHLTGEALSIIESEYTLPDFDMIHRMVQWAHKHGLEPMECVYANDMTSFFAKDRTTYCLEIYMPFKRIASPV